MWDKEFQQKSIRYPINVEDKTIASNIEWVYLPFYTNTSYIPCLHSDTLNYYDFEIINKNITLTSVSFNSKKFTDYKFNKQNFNWQLTNIYSDSIQNVHDSEFINFLLTFSNDSNYQIKHTEFPLQNYFLDSEKEYATVYEPIERESWKCFNLVKEIENLVILNIEKVDSDYRNILFRGVENGIYVKYTFRKTNGDWFLIKLEDYST